MGRELTIWEGKIYDLHHGNRCNQQMEIPEISIVEKIGVDTKDQKLPVYSFKMSWSTDPVWRLLFETAYPEAPVKIHGHNLDIACQPEELTTTYERAKKTIGITNRLYQAAIPKVRQIAEHQDKARREKQSAKEDDAKRIQDPFNQLDL